MAAIDTDLKRIMQYVAIVGCFRFLQNCQITNNYSIVAPLAIDRPVTVYLTNTAPLITPSRSHTCRYFRSEESGDSLLTIPVGNVTADTELTYEYGVRTGSNRPPPAAPPIATPTDEPDEDTPKSKGIWYM